MTAGGLRASVVIATYNRSALIPRLIEALEAQTLPRDAFEVIFVDDGSTDATPSVLAAAAERSPMRVRIAGDGRNRRQAAARNLGWRIAAAPIVAFTDDDCVPTARWLEAGLAAMGDDHRVIVGRVIPDPAQRAIDGPFSRTITVSDATYFETCNTFYRRADLEAVGGFDEAFTSHGGEDTDLGWRVVQGGADARFADDALVLHDVKPSSVRAAAKEAWRWTGIPRVVRLHPDARRFLYGRLFWKPAHPLAIAALAGAAIGVRSRPFLALALPWIAYRVVKAPLAPGRRRRWMVLPGALIVDLAEVGAMARGSIKARTLVL